MAYSRRPPFASWWRNKPKSPCRLRVELLEPRTVLSAMSLAGAILPPESLPLFAEPQETERSEGKWHDREALTSAWSSLQSQNRSLAEEDRGVGAHGLDLPPAHQREAVAAPLRIAEALAGFSGVRRRQEVVGTGPATGKGGSNLGVRTNDKLSAEESFLPVTTRLVSANSTKRVPAGKPPPAVRSPPWAVSRACWRR